MTIARPVLDTLVLSVEGPGGVDLGRLERTFPTVTIRVTQDGDTDLEESDWQRDDFDLDACDRAMDARITRDGTWAVRSSVRHAPRFGFEVLTRAQRWIDRRNAGSRGASFAALLDAVRDEVMRAGAVSVRSPGARALDAWQWALRLDPGAGEAVQLGALLRGWIDSEPEARASAERLIEERVEPGLRRVVLGMVADDLPPHERRSDAIWRDAEALHFCSLELLHVLRTHGVARARWELDRVLSGMGGRALAELTTIRLGRVGAELVDACLGGVRIDACA